MVEPMIVALEDAGRLKVAFPNADSDPFAPFGMSCVKLGPDCTTNELALMIKLPRTIKDPKAQLVMYNLLRILNILLDAKMGVALANTLLGASPSTSLLMIQD